MRRRNAPGRHVEGPTGKLLRSVPATAGATCERVDVGTWTVVVGYHMMRSDTKRGGLLLHRSIILIAAFCAVGAGCKEAPAPADPSAGKLIYDEHCAACHGPDGNVRLAERHDAATPDLRTVAERYGGRVPRVMLVEIIDGRRIVQAHGSRTMPVWGELLESEGGASVENKIDALVGYVESIQTQ